MFVSVCTFYHPIPIPIPTPFPITFRPTEGPAVPPTSLSAIRTKRLSAERSGARALSVRVCGVCEWCVRVLACGSERDLGLSRLVVRKNPSSIRLAVCFWFTFANGALWWWDVDGKVPMLMCAMHEIISWVSNQIYLVGDVSRGA